MSMVNIIIGAINKTKAVFNEVGTQVLDLNKKMNKLAGVMRGLFVAGVAAQFIKGILGATTETEKLQGAVGKIKDAFRPAIQIIADGLVSIISALSGPIAKVGEFIGETISRIQYLSAYAAALLETKSHDAAKAIAEQTAKQLDAERQMRIAAAETAKEKEQAAKKEIESTTKIAEQKAKAEAELAKLREDNAKKATELEEQGLTKQELLLKRQAELREQSLKWSRALEGGDEKPRPEAGALAPKNEEQKTEDQINKPESQRDQMLERQKAMLEAEGKMLDIAAEIKKLKEEIAEEEKKAAEDAEEAAESARERRIEEAAALAKKNEEQKTEEQINKLESQRDQMLERQKVLTEESTEKRRLALDEGARKEAKEAQKQQEREDKRFKSLLSSAKAKMASQGQGGFGPRLTESEKLAMESERARIGAEEAARMADELDKKAKQAQINSGIHLKKIDMKMQELLVLKE